MEQILAQVRYKDWTFHVEERQYVHDHEPAT